MTRVRSRKTSRPAVRAEPRPRQPGRVQPERWLPVLLLLLTALAYLPAMRAGWIWDDREYVWDNAALHSLAGLWQIWFDPTASQQYYPVVFTVFWLEHHLWGASPAGYHVINVAGHLVNTLLLWVLLRRLRVRGALFAAGLFALHPVQVESVAWVTELKNVLSGLFGLLTVLVWWRFTATRQWRSYALAVLLFACAMLSKTAACTLPLLLVLLAWWREQSGWRRELLPLAPFLVVSAGLGWVTIWREPGDIERALSLVDRLLVASQAFWFYLGKLVWPVPLMTIYPLWQIDPHDLVQRALAVGALAVPLTLWLGRHRLGRGPVVAVLGFLVLLAPVLGLVNFSFMTMSYVADHFQYLACIAPFALMAAALTRLTDRLDTMGGWPRPVAAGLVLVLLAGLTWQQARIYANAETLWRDNLAKNPQAWVARWGLGNALREQGRLDEADRQFALAAGLAPDFADTYYNWGQALAAQGRLDDAIDRYRTAVRLNPRRMAPHYDLALTLQRQGHLDEAAREMAEAIRVQPDMPALRVIYGAMLAKQGKLDEADSQLAEAVRLQPDYADARRAWAGVLLLQGKTAAAIEQYRVAARLAPEDTELRQTLQDLLAGQHPSP